MKIAINAGHWLGQAGKRTTSKPFMKEWEMNNKVANYVIELLEQYEDVEILRVDDPTGQTNVYYGDRHKQPNEQKVDLHLLIHHNAGGGTGVEVYKSYKDSSNLATLFSHNIATETKFKNRGMKTRTYYKYGLKYDYYSEIRKSKMPTYLLESGFMDNPKDIPIITSDKGQRDYANGIVKTLVKYYGLKLKEKIENPKLKHIGNTLDGKKIFIEL